MRSSLRARCLVAVAATISLASAGLGCGDDGGESGDSGDAKALLERAFAEPVKSGELEVDVEADIEGGGEKLEKPITAKVSGPFEWGGPKKLPRLDWDVAVEGAGLDLKGGLVATATNGFLEFQGQAYEVGTAQFASLARQFAAVQPEKRQSLGTFGVDPTSWLEDPKIDDDGETIGGEKTRKVTGAVDVQKAVKDIVDLTRSPRLRRQLERQGRPTPPLPKPTKEDLDKIEDAIEEFDIEVNVDKDDVVRRVFTELEIDLPGEQEGDDIKGGRLSVNYVLTKVATEAVIRPPQNAKPLGELLDGFGLGALGGGLDRR